MIVVVILIVVLLCLINIFNRIRLDMEADGLLDEVITYFILDTTDDSTDRLIADENASQEAGNDQSAVEAEIAGAEQTNAESSPGDAGESSGSMEDVIGQLPEVKVNEKLGFDIKGRNDRVFSFLYPDIKQLDVLGAMFFTVTVGPEGQVLDVDVSRTGETDYYAANMAISLFNEHKKTGWLEKCKYRAVENEDGSTTYVFLHRDRDEENWYRVLVFSCSAALLFFLGILVVTIFVSRKMLEPVEENIEKQKNFITNASHELKTPLAIIQTNAEALELYNGKNKWTSNINEQIGRLSVMLNNMLTLSRADEGAIQNAQEEVDLTSVTEEILEMYQEPAQRKNITLFRHLEESMPVRSSRTQIVQLLTILLDNAIKYSMNGTTVEVHVYTRDRNTIFETVNRCEQLPECEPERLFERFYRPDSSRYSSTPGNGIGLSAAKAIVSAYGGTISCKYEGKDSIHFSVLFHRLKSE